MAEEGVSEEGVAWGQSAGSISRLAGFVLLGVGLIIALYGKAMWLDDGPSLAHLLCALVGGVWFLFSYTRLSLGVVQGQIGSNQRPALLLSCGVSAFVLALVLSGYWVSPLVPFAGIAMLSLRVAIALPIVVLSIGTAAGILLYGGAPVVEIVNLSMGAVGVIFVYFFVGWLGALYREVSQVSTRITKMAVMEERLRFARDLHDIFGHSLSVISLKSELAVRLIDDQPKRARGEVESVADLSRRSIADIREVVRGYRMSTLAAEIEGIQPALESVGIRVKVSDVPEGLPPHIQEGLGWVLREASTNILQHSKATTCSVALWTDDSHVRLQVTNDGIQPRSRGSGNGLAGLDQRMRALGGKLSSGPGPGGIYRVEAVVPLLTPSEGPPEGITL